jgi:hypothetical protein
MAGERLVITELVNDGSFNPDGAARFEWTAQRQSVHQRPWTMGTAVRHKRTDYPGGDEPTFQIFGPNSKDQEFQGRWDDRYNGAGYARATRRAFNDMVRRCNLVRIEFSGLAFVGLITDVDYPFDYDARIGYRFSFSPQREEDAAPQISGLVDLPMTSEALVDNLSTTLTEISSLRESAPVAVLEGENASLLDELLLGIEQAFAEIDGAVQQRIVVPTDESRNAVLRVGQLFAQVRNTASRALDLLFTWKADSQMAWGTAKEVIAFDVWLRDLCAQLRQLALQSHESGEEVNRRADPTPRGLYRPYQGEDLRGVSQRFYGTPHQWRGIMLRNGLTSPILTGDELLVIPESGGAAS